MYETGIHRSQKAYKGSLLSHICLSPLHQEINTPGLQTISAHLTIMLFKSILPIFAAAGHASSGLKSVDNVFVANLQIASYEEEKVHRLRRQIYILCTQCCV